MDLLLVTPQLPYPPHQGTSLRNYHILRGLAVDDRISLLSYDEAGEEASMPSQLETLCDLIVTVPAPGRSSWQRFWQMTTSGQPDMALRLRSAEFAGKLKRLLWERSFQVVQIEGVELAWIIPIIRRHAPDAKIVYDAHNAEALLQQRAGEADRKVVRRWPAAIYSQIQSARLRRYEAWVCRSVDRITAVSEPDREALLGLVSKPTYSITVIPNCIDVFSYAESSERASDSEGGLQFDVVFSGKMDYRPNVDAVLWFADKVWPAILAQKPSASWAIVGQKPHQRLERLRSVPGVTLTGRVEEIKPYLAGARVFIMPFRVGSGTRLKLIEAMAARLAIVSTLVGVEGFPIEEGRQLLIAETGPEFASQVLRLMQDDNLRGELGREGQRFARLYDWRTVIPRFQLVYDDMMRSAVEDSAKGQGDKYLPVDM